MATTICGWCEWETSWDKIEGWQVIKEVRFGSFKCIVCGLGRYLWHGIGDTKIRIDCGRLVPQSGKTFRKRTRYLRVE